MSCPGRHGTGANAPLRLGWRNAGRKPCGKDAVMDRVRELLRSGAWLTPERIRLVAAALLIASAAGFLFLVVTAHGVIDRQHRPLGTDFSNVYAAGTYVLEGQAAAPFSPPAQYARERAIFGDDTQFYGC